MTNSSKESVLYLGLGNILTLLLFVYPCNHIVGTFLSNNKCVV